MVIVVKKKQKKEIIGLFKSPAAIHCDENFFFINPVHNVSTNSFADLVDFVSINKRDKV